MAFKMAASLAFKEGIMKAGPVLQEPIMKVEVVVPEEFLGDVMGQLNGDVASSLVQKSGREMLKRSKQWFPWRKCLDMPQTCGLELRDVGIQLWNLITMPRCPRA